KRVRWGRDCYKTSGWNISKGVRGADFTTTRAWCSWRSPVAFCAATRRPGSSQSVDWISRELDGESNAARIRRYGLHSSDEERSGINSLKAQADAPGEKDVPRRGPVRGRSGTPAVATDRPARPGDRP